MRVLNRLMMVFALLALLTGCGRSPISPDDARSRLTPTTNTIPDDDTPPDEAPAPRWDGGPRSLPFGSGTTTTELRDKALTLEPTLVAIAEFERRGYQRAASIDSAVIGPQCSAYLIGYTKPGYSASQVRAYIVVVTKNMVQYRSFWSSNPGLPPTVVTFPVQMCATQVGGGLIACTDQDSMVFVNSAEDPAFFIQGTLSTPAGSALACDTTLQVPEAAAWIAPTGPAAMAEAYLPWLSCFDYRISTQNQLLSPRSVPYWDYGVKTGQDDLGYWQRQQWQQRTAQAALTQMNTAQWFALNITVGTCLGGVTALILGPPTGAAVGYSYVYRSMAAGAVQGAVTAWVNQYFQPPKP